MAPAPFDAKAYLSSFANAIAREPQKNGFYPSIPSRCEFGSHILSCRRPSVLLRIDPTFSYEKIYIISYNKKKNSTIQ